MGEFVKFEVQDHIGVVTIDRPPVNAVCESIRLDLREIFESLNTRTDVYCVILRAENRCFSAGHDLKEAGIRIMDDGWDINYPNAYSGHDPVGCNERIGKAALRFEAERFARAVKVLKEDENLWKWHEERQRGW